LDRKYEKEVNIDEYDHFIKRTRNLTPLSPLQRRGDKPEAFPDAPFSFGEGPGMGFCGLFH
jgi:hypothetical protein